MFCRNCGAQIPEKALFCTHCGTKVAQPETPIYTQSAPVKESAPQPETPIYTQSAPVKESAPQPEMPIYTQSAPVKESAPRPETPIYTQSAPVKESAPRPETPIYTQSAPVWESAPQPAAAAVNDRQTVVRGGSTGGGVMRGILSVICCIVLVLGLLSAGVIFLIRHAVSTGSLEKVVNEIDVSDILLSDVEGEPTLSEYVYDNVDPSIRKYLKEDTVEKLLEEDFVKEFLVSKLADYADDLFHNTGTGEIKPKEIRNLLESNQGKIERITDCYFDDGDFDEITETLKSSGALDDISMETLRKQNSQVFGTVRTMCSYWMMVLFLVIAVAAAIGLFLLQKSKIRGFLYAGVSFVIVGILYLVVGMMAEDMMLAVNGVVSLGSSFWRTVADPIRTAGLQFGGVVAVVGVIAIAVFVIGSRIGRKKNA